MTDPGLHIVEVERPTPLAGLLVSSLDHRWEKFEYQLRRCQRNCSESAVHDLRVATRRLLAIVDIQGILSEYGSEGTVRRDLKRAFRELGPLRDVQVQIKRLENIRDQFPELEQFHATLLLRERRLLKKIGRIVRTVRVRSVELRLGDMRRHVLSLLGEGTRNQAAREVVVGAVAAAFFRASALLDAVNESDLQTIHLLRIAFKKFRYLTEVFQPLLAWVTRDSLRAMNRYQVRMGVIQDNEVFGAAFRRYLHRTSKTTRGSFLPFQQALVREHDQLVKEFLGGRDELRAFWTSPTGSVRTIGNKRR